MKCVKCGKDLGPNDVFCSVCGTKVQKINENSNQGIKNQNSYSYERPVNQQVNYNQQQNQQNYGQANNYGQPYKSKNAGDIAKIVVIALVAFILLLAMIFGGYLIISKVSKNIKQNQNNNVNNSVNNTVNDNQITNNTASNKTSTGSNNGGGTLTPTTNKKTSSYKVSYAGFKLYIPDNLMYEMDYTNNAINIGDTESTWMAQLGIRQGSFQQLKQNKNALTTYLTTALAAYEAKVSNAEIETIDGVEFILLECNLSGMNEIIGYTELNSMNTAYFEILNENNDFDRNVIKNLIPIISSAEYTGDSSYLKSNENVKMTDITNALDKALEAK